MALALPNDVAFPNTSTIELASAVPRKIGVVTFVILSVPEIPESSSNFKSGNEGAAGACVSIVTESTADASPVLPAASVAFAVML